MCVNILSLSHWACLFVFLSTIFYFSIFFCVHSFFRSLISISLFVPFLSNHMSAAYRTLHVRNHCVYTYFDPLPVTLPLSCRFDIHAFCIYLFYYRVLNVLNFEFFSCCRCCCWFLFISNSSSTLCPLVIRIFHSIHEQWTRCVSNKYHKMKIVMCISLPVRHDFEYDYQAP